MHRQVAIKLSRKLLRRSLLLRKLRLLRYPNEPSDSYEAYCKCIQRIDNLDAIRKLTLTPIKNRLSAIAIMLEKLEEENSKALAIMEKLEEEIEDLHNKCTAHWL